MQRKIIAASLALLVTACSWWGQGSKNKTCPQVFISRNNAYFVLKGTKYEDFSVELVGFEGYCYFDARINHDKAVVSPIFKVKRLRPTDETDVLVSYYTETIKGPPEYLGKQTYFARIRIPLNQTEVEYKARQAEVRLPPEMKYEFDINLGLHLSKNDRDYNQKTFDVPLKYKEQ